jgi:hypothetical protein
MNTVDPRDAIRRNLAEGEAIVERAFSDYGIRSPRGPTLEYVPSPPRPSVFNSEPPPSPAVPRMIEAANDLASCGCRPIALALIVTRIRQRFVEFEAAGELPEGERTWPAFVTRHLPRIGLARANEMVRRVTRQSVEEASATPMTALDRALAAITTSPEMSNRAIAKQIQVDEGTVRSARKKLREAATDSARDSAPTVTHGERPSDRSPGITPNGLHGASSMHSEKA